MTTTVKHSTYHSIINHIGCAVTTVLGCAVSIILGCIRIIVGILISIAACVYAGMLSYIPYQIFNIVKLVSILKGEKKVQNSEPDINN